ncbi:CRP-like cAMP-binding protein [Mucilaginibacter gracilis]|uniref:CRP-like cAMP-binding protein n=1 Tax=Mucilaginibacter gracilis TaxID=423350 RepID=A0A495J5B4_9SPHI|nr:Crp/Fnr family transcriptional regulator [Mucilaginibacter gracilis]RKR83598.1 CRP-like cAMP-binding protein [Mucilaginibacter gracilis]
MIALINHIKKFVPLTDEEAALISNSVTIQNFRKKDLLLQPGKVCKSTYFVVQGCLRLYFINRKQNEQITQFAIENWWITDQDSFDNRIATGYYIQAVENTQVIALNKDVLDELFIRIPKLERYFRLVLQKVYTAWQRRMKFIFDQTDEERYGHFSSSFPEFMQRVPQYMIASYLGFTPQFLSKIRAKKQ